MPHRGVRAVGLHRDWLAFGRGQRVGASDSGVGVFEAGAGALVLASVVIAAPQNTAEPAGAAGPVITVATFNVCKKTCGSGQFAWRYRKHSVVRNIAASGADVVAVQEAAGTIRQIAAGLAPLGYTLANRATEGCGRGCTQDAFVLYRSGVIEPLGVRSREGTATLSAVTDVPWSGTTYDRGWSWAYLRHKASGMPMLVASVHLPADKSPQGERLREAGARGIVRYLEANKQMRGMSRVPTFIAGDLNSFRERQPSGAQSIIERAGYRDVHRVGRRENARVPTINVTRAHRNPFPARPFRSRTPARLDYVFSDQGLPLHYEVFLRLEAGRFDDRYRSSDHNLVLGTVRLPAVGSW